MQHLEVSCAVQRFFKSLGFKWLQHISKFSTLLVSALLFDLKENLMMAL